jgi:endonuclease III related protein
MGDARRRVNAALAPCSGIVAAVTAHPGRPRPSSDGRRVRAIYARLLRERGHANWWPGETPFEVCVGAILTQNTAWSNVEKALAALRERGLLSYAALSRLPVSRLAPLIRSSGYYNVKARRLRAFLRFLGRGYAGRAEGMRGANPWTLRAQLLAVDGIGRETADSIVLYAAELPLFVVDAYTRRVFGRLGLLRGDESYDEVQRFFMQRLPADVGLYNDFHAQVVLLGKDVCRTRPRCDACPLGTRCPRRGVRSFAPGVAGSRASRGARRA